MARSPSDRSRREADLPATAPPGEAAPGGQDAAVPRDPAIEHLAAYRQAFRTMDPDRVHDVLAQRSQREILRKEAAYLIASARNARNKRWTRDRKQRERLDSGAASILPLSPPTPAEIVERNETLRLTIAALSDLPETDQLIVWRFAEGYSDPEIRAELAQILPREEVPTEATIRKRRERTRSKLREALAKGNASDRG